MLDALRKLYPDFSDDELIEVKENLERYLLLAWEIWEANRQSTLTRDEVDSRIKAKVDPHTN